MFKTFKRRSIGAKKFDLDEIRIMVREIVNEELERRDNQ
jgi:hypothetical protein